MAKRSESGESLKTSAATRFTAQPKPRKKKGKDGFRLINKLEFAKTIVKEAGSYLREHLHDQLAITVKTNPTDLVTQMDQEVQATLVRKILEAYPEDQIFAEEDELRAPIHSGKVWVIDPIDGTNNFVTQKEDFAVMVAYFEEGLGQFGLIYDVMRDHLFFGGKDFGVFCNDQELKPLSKSAYWGLISGF